MNHKPHTIGNACPHYTLQWTHHCSHPHTCTAVWKELMITLCWQTHYSFIPTTPFICNVFTIKVDWLLAVLQLTAWQLHGVQRKRGGGYHAMASSQGLLNDGWKREKEWGLMAGWCGSECHGVVFSNSRCQPHALVPYVWGTVTCVSKPVCCCKASKSFGVGMLYPLGALCKALGKRNGFEDDVVAQQPPHSCLVVHNTVCHVTPCVFPSFWTTSETMLQLGMPVVFVVSMLSCSVQKPWNRGVSSKCKLWQKSGVTIEKKQSKPSKCENQIKGDFLKKLHPFRSGIFSVKICSPCFWKLSVNSVSR